MYHSESKRRSLYYQLIAMNLKKISLNVELTKSQLIVGIIIMLFASIGLYDSYYLTLEKMSGYIPPCHAGFSCATVLTSKWSAIGSIPISFFGMLFYVSALLISLVILVIPQRFKRQRIRKLSYSALFLLSLLSFIVSMFLVYVMGVELKAWCQYCLISAFSTTSIFALASYVKFIESKKALKLLNTQ